METKITNHAPHNSIRNCLLDNWVVCGTLCNDGQTWLFYLTGQVIREADGTYPPARITKTSPIVAYEAGVVTTVSGSKYKLGRPHQLQTEGTKMLTGDFLNPWIDGDNWLTR